MSNYNIQAVIELRDRFTNVINRVRTSTERVNNIINRTRQSINNLGSNNRIQNLTNQFNRLGSSIKNNTISAVKKLGSALSKLKAPVIKFGKWGFDKFTGGIKSAISSIQSTISGMFKFITAGVIGALGYGIKKAMDYEAVRTSLKGTLYGDEEKTKQYYDKAVKLSEKTAFSPEEVVQSFSTLLAGGIDPNMKNKSGVDVASRMMDLASKTLEKDLNKFTNALVKAKGGNADELFESLIPMGYDKKTIQKIGMELAKSTGNKNYANMFDKNLGFDSKMGQYLVNTILYIADKDKRISGEADRFSKTGKGALSTLKGNVDQFLKTIVDPEGSGTGIFGYFKRGMVWMNNNIDFKGYGKKISDWIRTNVIDKLPNVEDLKTAFDIGFDNDGLIGGIKNVLTEIWGSDLFTGMRAFWNKIEPIIDIAKQMVELMIDIVMSVAQYFAPKRKSDDELRKMKEEDPFEYLRYLKAYDWKAYQEEKNKLGVIGLSELKDAQKEGWFAKALNVSGSVLGSFTNETIKWATLGNIKTDFYDYSDRLDYLKRQEETQDRIRYSLFENNTKPFENKTSLTEENPNKSSLLQNGINYQPTINIKVEGNGDAYLRQIADEVANKVNEKTYLSLTQNIWGGV